MWPPVVEVYLVMLHTTSQGSLWLQIRRFLKFSSRKSIFSLLDLEMQRTRTIWTIMVEGNAKIICVKLF